MLPQSALRYLSHATRSEMFSDVVVRQLFSSHLQRIRAASYLKSSGRSRLLGVEYNHRVPDILVIGSLNADLVVRAPRFPGPGETISGEDLQIFPGGKGANQAVAAAKQNASVTMCGLSRRSCGMEVPRVACTRTFLYAHRVRL